MATWSDLKIKLIGTGDETGTWGITTNENFNNVIEQAITGTATVTFADANVTLSLIDSTDLQDARALRLFLTGVTTTSCDLTVPAIQKFYIIDNDLPNNITVKNPTGVETFTVPAGTSALVFSTGTGVVSAVSYFSGALTSFLAVITGGTIDGTSIGATTASTGAFTTLSATAATFTNALPVLSGGTGVTSSTGTGSVVLSASPTLTGTPLAPTATAGTNTTQIASTQFVTSAVSTATGALGTMSTQNANAVSITGGTISGLGTPLEAASGGTGLASPGASGNVLTSNGTSWVSSSSKGRLINTLYITTVGANTYTPTTGISYAIVTIVGGGGGSTGIGGTTSFGAIMSATGGNFGQSGPLGGTGTGGDINVGGGSGSSTFGSNGTLVPGTAAFGLGSPAGGYGGGGGGGYLTNCGGGGGGARKKILYASLTPSVTVTIGAGGTGGTAAKPGICIIEEYS